MRRLLASLCALVALLAFPAGGFADTTFGGNPAEAPTTTYLGKPLDCAYGQPFPEWLEIGPPPGQGSANCSWSVATGAANDFVPFGASGGSGIITAVTLPAMANPGPMQAVVLTGTAIIPQGSEPGRTEFACCKIKEVSPQFTVPANQVTTVPLDLAVAAQPNISKAGETQNGDIMMLTMDSGTATMPLLFTGSESDDDWVYYLGAKEPSSGYIEPGTTQGFQLLAQWHLGPVPTATPASTPAVAPAPASPVEGVKLRGAVTVKAGGKTAVLGKATDPPTERTIETLTGTLPAGKRAARASAAKSAKLGSGKTKIASGTSAPIEVNLTRATRAALARGATIHAKAKVVASGPGGTKTLTKSVTLSEKKKKKRA